MWLRVMANREAKGIAEQLAEETAEDKQVPRLLQLTGQKQMGESRNQVSSAENEWYIFVMPGERQTCTTEEN